MRGAVGMVANVSWCVNVAGKGIYRHDAEGSDDMPVMSSHSFIHPFKKLYSRRIQGLIRTWRGGTGTYQIITDRGERQYSDFEWEVGDGDVAGDMVFGVSEWETEAEGAGYDSGGEDVKRVGGMMDGWS